MDPRSNGANILDNDNNENKRKRCHTDDGFRKHKKRKKKETQIAMVGKSKTTELDSLIAIKNMGSRYFAICSCKYPGCRSKDLYCDGLCKSDYERLRRELIAIRKPGCSVSGCTRKNCGVGDMCRRHYDSYRRIMGPKNKKKKSLANVSTNILLDLV
jgi:hypothetical protein